MKNLLKDLILPAFWLFYFFFSSRNNSPMADHEENLANLKKEPIELKTKNSGNTYISYYNDEK